MKLPPHVQLFWGGSFIQSGGTLQTGSMYADSTFSMTGGSLLSGLVYVGSIETGTQRNAAFDQSGGVHAAQRLVVGDNPSFSATYSLSGAGLLTVAGDEVLGTI